jgi:hypothetical protein
MFIELPTEYPNDRGAIITCLCGDVKEHSLYLRRDAEEEEVYISSTLNIYLPWWKRILVALKYIFGVINTTHTYTEIVVSKRDRERLKSWL